MNKIEYQYKDVSRYYWRIFIWKDGEQPCWSGSDDVDFIWNYTIERSFSGEANWQMVYNEGRIVGQYDMKPEPNEIMRDFMGYMQMVAIGCSDSQTGARQINI